MNAEPMFLKLVYGVGEYDDYFKCNKDTFGMVGLSSVQKCTAALRCLANGSPPDTHDEYLTMSESTFQEIVYMFCRAFVVVFGPIYLRVPNEEDTSQILA